MPDGPQLVINTGPIIALVAALGDLRILRSRYARVVVPYEVCQEILVDSASRFAAIEFDEDKWVSKMPTPCTLMPILRNTLDVGEASVIQTAVNEGITTVCIDEPVGRRIARLCSLHVTGSLGIIIQGKRSGIPIVVKDAIGRMIQAGIHLSSRLVDAALKEANEA
jgi:predicted nucleic acid-binding protein